MGNLYIFERDSKSIMRKNIILIVLADIVILGVLLLFSYCLLIYEKTSFKLLACAVVTAVDVFVAACVIKKQFKKHNYFLSELEKIPYVDGINRQAEEADCMLGAFCMLEEFLYVPKQRILIPYTEIVSVNVKKTSVNFVPAAATVHIQCTNRRYYAVSLNSAFDLKRRYGEFINVLNAKRNLSYINSDNA